jgi:hypothetical protein
MLALEATFILTYVFLAIRPFDGSKSLIFEGEF